MAKKNTQYRCTNCNNVTGTWMGKCNSCDSWNTLEEELKQDKSVASGLGVIKNRLAMTSISGEVTDLNDININEFPRIKTDIEELDNVLGGGLVQGSVILIGGEPGIGKSTLLIQVTDKLNKKGEKVLYISGEESTQQIASRADRLKLKKNGIRINSETEIDKILTNINNEKPRLVIIDSIQTMYSEELSSTPGSVSQIKECATRLNRCAKDNGITIILVGHVTKDGDLAGPRVLEHTVDTVLYFEGERDNTIRLLRGFKNRFGSVNEIGIFSMGGMGLEEVRDISTAFISNSSNVIGSCLFMTQEGNKPLLIEVQALLDETQANIPIKSAVGFDQKRLSMLMAIANKYLKAPLYKYNTFVTLIGGIKTIDPTVDLAILLSLISSATDKSMPSKLAAFGEIGLTGELRHNHNYESRIKEASRLGLEIVLMPDVGEPKRKELEKKYQIKIKCFKDVFSIYEELKNNFK